MKKLFVLALMLVSCCGLQAQNIEGQIIASQYGRWKVPGYAADTYSSFAPGSCRVQGGASFFFAFNVGTPVTIVDSNPSLTETVVPTATVNSNVACSVSIAPVNSHQLPFSIVSATGGLQEALNQNLTNPQANTVILDNAFYNQVGGAGNVATIIAAAQGNSNLGLMDVTQVPTVWYRWNGSQYVRVGNGGVGTGLNTLANDLVSNNATNSGAQDLNDFVATGGTVYSPQAAVNAAAANNGSVILQPGVGRTPFTNIGNVRVEDNRADVPATARSVTEFGAVCDTRQVYGTLVGASTTLSLIGGALTPADIGRHIVAVGVAGGLPTQFDSVLVSITDSLHGVLTTASPFTQAVAHEMDLGHDDTAAIAQGMTAVGSGGTLVFPAGYCLTHTQALKGQSPIGLGMNSQILGFPGEDIFAAPDPSQGPGFSQGAAHIHDLTFLLDSRIDATLAWQTVNDTGTIAHAAMYRPIAHRTAVANNPVAPGWFQGPGTNLSGAYNGVAAITAGSPVMCVPNSEAAPAIGQKVVFPYLATVYTGTVNSTGGSCAAGSTARTLTPSLPSGSTNAQAEWFAGTSPQNLATAIGAGACPATITLANSINPVPGYESNVAAFGLVQIDAEQFSYFARSTAGNPTPANTLYNVQCGQNGTARAAHSAGATVAPLNNFKPSYPWPVTPTLNSGDTTPSATAGYFPGWNVGNAAFAFPLATGINQGSGTTGAWTANAHIENLSFFPWPNEINGESWSGVNHTAMLYAVSPSYATTFSNLFALFFFYGIAIGPPSIENGNYATAQPTGDGTHWDGITIYAANPVNIPLGNQNTFSNFNVYSSEGSVTGPALGADTCFYFSALYNDQTGGVFDVLSLDHFTNMYCENESGAHDVQMPILEWDTFNSEIEDQHMGGGGEVMIGGGQQHWIGGNFNNAIGTPVINFGTGNTADYVTGLGSEPKGNVYGANTLINFAPFSKFSGTTSQRFSTATGPYGGLQVGNSREPIASQTAETFFTGNLTQPYTSLGGGFITPEEFNASFAFESQAMSVGWTYDATSPITSAYAACNVGNNTGSIYCATGQFNQETMPVGPGQRIVPGKYTMYVSLKDATTATNTETFSIFSNCSSFQNIYNIPITNAWPTTAAGVFTAPIDFSSLTGSNCSLGVRFWGATTADQVQIGYLDFAPVAEQLNAQTINVTTINLPGGTTGGTPTGCAQSPVTGIQSGYECPTAGWNQALIANQLIGDTSITIASTIGLPPAGCFFIDAEYECFTHIQSSTVLNGITRGAYATTPAAHTAGGFPGVVSVNLIFGPPNQLPFTGMFGFNAAAPLLGVNNAYPQNHANASVMSINNGANELWFDTSGGMHQQNPSAFNTIFGSFNVGTHPGSPSITDTAQVMQSTVAASMYQPQTLGGGHAGSLNVIQTPVIPAPTILAAVNPGSTTISYVCAGTDFDGNLIPGTTATITNGAATFTFPQGYQINCPYVAGVNTYQLYRTAGGPSQGFLATATGPGAVFSDYGGAATAGSPPSSNASNPHISVAGTGNPTITMGTGGSAPSITFSSAAPSGACNSGSLWSNSGGSPNTLYVCQAGAWVGK